MFLILLQICFSASAPEEDSGSIVINKWQIYKGMLTYDDDVGGTDGSCIACNGSCIPGHEVKPHSWTAILEYTRDGEVEHGDFGLCQEYAQNVVQYGVVAFTWRTNTYSCSLHVIENDHNISEEMWIFNRFEWREENPKNTGPLYLAKFPSEKYYRNLTAMCYYGLNVKGTQNMASEMNVALIVSVVVIMLSWNGWMRYTKNYPWSNQSTSESTGAVSQHAGHEAVSLVHLHDLSDKQDSSGKKDE